mgnify:CR=1 FL=1
MDDTPIHVDEFGTLRFIIYQDDSSYEFEQEADSDFLFVTMRDAQGRAVNKQVVDIKNKYNKSILDLYDDYLILREQDESDEEEESSDD